MYLFGGTYTKIGTIQRRLAWPLRKDDTQNREAFHIFRILSSSLQHAPPRLTSIIHSSIHSSIHPSIHPSIHSFTHMMLRLMLMMLLATLVGMVVRRWWGECSANSLGSVTS